MAADLTSILRPNTPPDLRLKRLVVELANVDRPQSVLTWMRKKEAADLLRQIGTRELALTHEAFNELPAARSVEHLRAMLVNYRILPDQGDPSLARFERWLALRLESLEDRPQIKDPIEQFARWHHLRRMHEGRTRNMANAASNAKQEITETGKFLTWLLDVHGVSIESLTQAHVDQYFSIGTKTRFAARNFLQWRAKTRIGPKFELRYREALDTPMESSRRRLELIRNVVTDDSAPLGSRIAALIFVLYACPVRKIAEMQTAQISVTPIGMSLQLGEAPAKIPEPLLPLFHDYLQSRANQRTTNAASPWLFPGTRAGQHLTEQSLLHTFRDVFGIDIRAVRNATLHDLAKEVDAASLASLLGYSTPVMTLHAARAGVLMASYPAMAQLDDWRGKSRK